MQGYDSRPRPPGQPPQTVSRFERITAADLAAALERTGCKVTKDRAGYRASCPLHGGNSGTSLLITENNGEATAYCFGGCGNVWRAIRQYAGLWQDAPAREYRRPTDRPVARPPETRPAPDLLEAPPGNLPGPDFGREYARQQGWPEPRIRIYPYRFAAGRGAVLCVIRFDWPGRKEVRRASWDGQKWRMGGTDGNAPKPFYRHRFLHSRPHAPVLILEGKRPLTPPPGWISSSHLFALPH